MLLSSYGASGPSLIIHPILKDSRTKRAAAWAARALLVEARDAKTFRERCFMRTKVVIGTFGAALQMAKVVTSQVSPSNWVFHSQAGQAGALSCAANAGWLLNHNQLYPSLKVLSNAVLEAVGEKSTASSFQLESESWPLGVRPVHTRARPTTAEQFSDAQGVAQPSSHKRGLQGYQRPVSLGELKERKKQQEARRNDRKPKQEISTDVIGVKAKEDGGSTAQSSPALRKVGKRAEVPGAPEKPPYPLPPVKDALSKPDKTKSIKNTAANGEDVTAANGPSQPAPRCMTVEEFLRRKAEKHRLEGLEEKADAALSALDSLRASPSSPSEHQKLRQGPRKAANGRAPSSSQWKTQNGDEAEVSGEPDASEIASAKEKAVSVLNRRHISALELQNKLVQNGFSETAVKAAVERMQEVGLQSDLEYAEAFARVRWQGFKWGPERVRRELKLKGIGLDHRETAIRAVYGDRADALRVSLDTESGWENTELDSEEDLSAQVERELYIAAKRHFKTGRTLDWNKQWKRTADWLARRGFGWGTISSIMAALKAESESEKADGSEPL